MAAAARSAATQRMGATESGSSGSHRIESDNKKRSKIEYKIMMPFGSRCDRGELNHLTKCGVITCRNNLPIWESIVWPTTVEDNQILPGTMG